MKKLIVLLAVFMSLNAGAMKIVKDEIDEFTGERTVITSWEPIQNMNDHIRFRHQNGRNFVDYKFFYDGAIVVGEGDKLMVKATNDSITTFVSISTVSGTIGGGAVGLSGSRSWGIDVTYTGDIEWFETNLPKLMRIYTTDRYIDKKVSEKDGYKIQKLALLFTNTIDGNKDFKLVTGTMKFMKKRKKSKEWELVKEEVLTDALSGEINKIIDDWKSQSNDTLDYDVQIKKSKN